MTVQPDRRAQDFLTRAYPVLMERFICDTGVVCKSQWEMDDTGFFCTCGRNHAIKLPQRVLNDAANGRVVTYYFHKGYDEDTQ